MTTVRASLNAKETPSSTPEFTVALLSTRWVPQSAVHGLYAEHDAIRLFRLQGDASTPAPHAPAATSQCSYRDSLAGNGAAVVTAAVSVTTTPSGTASGMSSTSTGSATSSGGLLAATGSASTSSGSSSTSSSKTTSTSTGTATQMATIVRSVAAASNAVSSAASSVQSAAASASSTSGGSQNAVVVFTLALAGAFGIALTAF